MKQLAVAGLMGMAAGATLVIAFSGERLSPLAGLETGRVLDDVATMSAADAEVHRSERYANIESVEAVLSLPTSFARREALYVLASRSDSGEVQNLIYEADRIADRIERVSTLNVLFARLTELDQASALAVARGPRFAREAGLEAQVWRVWAKDDFDAALSAANRETSWSARNRAAQALFSAYGYLENNTIDEIRLTLGVEPDETTRSRYLYLLAERSPREAVDYINGLPTNYGRQQAATRLANYLGPIDAERAADLSDSLDDPMAERAYRRAVAAATVAADPAATLERILGEQMNNENALEAQAAIRTLASRDVDAALQFYQRARGRNQRDLFGRVIVEALAQSDPARALTWARENDAGGNSFLLYRAIQQVAVIDHELVLTEIGGIQNRTQRSQALEAAVSAVVVKSPERAIEMFERVDGIANPDDIAANLVSQWIQSEPEAALDWAMSREASDQSTVLLIAGMQLARRDPDVAIRLLPRLPDEAAQTWRQQIATSLAQSSPDRALDFLNRYGGTDEHHQLQVAVVEGLAEVDIGRAKALADRLPDAGARATAYAHLVAQRANADPHQARQWLDMIDDERQQGYAARSLAGVWYKADPAAAMSWVKGLPQGVRRDHAILGMASWRPDPELRGLIGSIEDDVRRNQATQRLVQSIARTDWREAQEVLDESTLTAEQKENMQQMIDHYRSSGR